MVEIEVEPEEQELLVQWKKRTDTLVLPRLKAEAVLYASKGVPAEVIAQFVDRSSATVKGWLRDWGKTRMCSVVTGHAGNQNAAKLTREQKEEVRRLLAAAPSDDGAPAELWDVPKIKDVVKALFDVEYESDSSYCLLLRFCGFSFKVADTVDKRRDEALVTARMAEIRAQVARLLADGYEVYTIDEVRVEHETETRRTWLRRGQRTKIKVDTKSVAMSFFGALSLTTKKMKIYPVDGKQNTENVLPMFSRLQRETPGKMAVVLDNASFHRSAAFREAFAKGQELEHVVRLYFPPYAPDHNPTEHVWNASKGELANIQHERPEHTFSAFMAYVTGREFDYNFENLPTKRQDYDLV